MSKNMLVRQQDLSKVSSEFELYDEFTPIYPWLKTFQSFYPKF